MIGTAIVVLHAYVFRALTFHADVLTLWLPTFCHLGRTIASGHVPAWDPYVMGGVPFKRTDHPVTAPLEAIRK